MRCLSLLLSILISSASFSQATLTHFKDTSGKYGFKNKAGTVVIPAKYDDARFFHLGLARVKSGINWGFIDESGKEIIPIKYQDADTLSEGLARVKLNNKWGYIDNNGKEIIPAKYQNAGNFYDGAAWVKLDDKYGYIDKTGKEITPVKYELLAAYFHEGMARVKLNSKWGFIDRKGKELIPLKFDSAYSFDNGLARVQAGGKWGAIDKAGKEVIPLKYHSIEKDYFEWEEWMEETGWFSVKLNANEKSRLIDKKGKELKFTGYSPYGFSEGLMAVSANNKWGYVDFNYHEKIQMKYTVANDFEQGLALVKLNEKWGYLDTTGKVVIPIKYDSIEYNNIKHAKQTWFKFQSKGKWGLLNKSGKEFIAAKYDELGLRGSPYFSEGLMPVKLNGKWGYIDSTGNLVIPSVYDEAFVFTGGKANVKKDGKVTRIDNPLIKKTTPHEVTNKPEIKNPEPEKQNPASLLFRGRIDPDLVGTWRYYDPGLNHNSYYILRADGSYDYWSDMMSRKAPAPNPKNQWRIIGDDLELLPEGSKEIYHQRVLKRNDPQNKKPALLFETTIKGTFRTYYPTETKKLWAENSETVPANKNSIKPAAVKLATPPVKLNGSVDLSIIGLWKHTISNTDYFLDIKADGTYETWSSSNPKKSKAYWRIDNGFMELVFEGNKKTERFQFSKANDLATGKPTIMIVSTVYYPQTAREMWKH